MWWHACCISLCSHTWPRSAGQVWAFKPPRPPSPPRLMCCGRQNSPHSSQRLCRGLCPFLIANFHNRNIDTTIRKICNAAGGINTRDALKIVWLQIYFWKCPSCVVSVSDGESFITENAQPKMVCLDDSSKTFFAQGLGTPIYLFMSFCK